jgi:hypothetical protein
MDRQLRSLYREHGGNDNRFLLACARAGYIPADSHISLDQLPEIAKHQNVGTARVGLMSAVEMDIVMHQKLRGRSTIGELVAEYVLDSDAWTLFGWDKQAIINAFTSWLQALDLEDYLEETSSDWGNDPDEQVQIGVLPISDDYIWSFSAGDASDEEIAVHLFNNRILDDASTLKVVQLAWGVHGRRLEATVEVTSDMDGKETHFFITLFTSAPLPNYLQLTSIMDSVFPPSFDNYMLLIGQDDQGSNVGFHSN